MVWYNLYLPFHKIRLEDQGLINVFWLYGVLLSEIFQPFLSKFIARPGILGKECSRFDTKIKFFLIFFTQTHSL